MNNTKYTKICPKCGNLDLFMTSFAQIFAANPYKCEKCNYSGLFPEININDIEKFRKNIKKKF